MTFGCTTFGDATRLADQERRYHAGRWAMHRSEQFQLIRREILSRRSGGDEAVR